MSDTESLVGAKLRFKKKPKKGLRKNAKKNIVQLDFSEDEDQAHQTSSEDNSQPPSKKSKLQQLADEEKLKNAEHNHDIDEDPMDSASIASDNLDQDRDWYAGDDYGNVYGDDYNPFGLENQVYDEEKEAKLKMSAIKRITSERKSKQEARDLWESNRMVTSGTMRKRNIESDFTSDVGDTFLEIIVKYTTPHFLSENAKNIGSIANTQRGPVLPFRHPDSDMAACAKRGSLLVKEHLRSTERRKQAKEATSMAGTTLNTILGKDDEAEEAEVEASTGGTFIDALKKRKQDGDMQASEFSRKMTISEQRKSLPAYTVRNELLQVIAENQLVVVIGETGSGKTTQLAQYLYEEGYASRGLIGCTQPRRVAAMSVAQRVSEEMGCPIGSTVGFLIRFEECTLEDTKIRYMTDGILLKETLSDPLLNKYSCIIIDEAHERTLNTDILLGLFKNILAQRMDLRIIITSATMNAEKFSRYYGNAPQFTIPGRTFPVDILYLRVIPEDYIEHCVKTCITIHLTRGPGDVLVFLTGKADIDTCCDVLDERLKELASKENDRQGVGEIPKYEILPIYSQMPADLQAKVFDRTKHGTRKIVVATNIAETSLTIDNVKYVVDAGYYKIKIFNSKMGMDTLQMAPISLANANQRSGRAGRTAPGVAYRLYTESAAKNDLYPETIPEIQRTNLLNTVLMLKSLNVNDVSRFPFLDAPSSDSITGSLYELWSMGALDEMGELTALGKKMVRFPMEPSLSKLLINSVALGCTEDMITIVLMLLVPNVFYRPLERQEESDASREKFFVPESDHLTLLNVYSQWKANKYSSSWCNKHFLHAKSLRRAKDIRTQLQSIMQQQYPNAKNTKSSDWDVIRKCICSGYFHQACKVKGFGRYASLKTGLELHLHPTSALFGLGDLPKYIVYHELIFTSKEYMSYVTEVDPAWLADYGSAFYTLRQEKVGNLGSGTIWDST